MRLLDFAGIAPKVHRTKLSPAAAQRAVNVDLYGAKLQGLPSPIPLRAVTDVYGNRLATAAKTLHIAGNVVIGFSEHTFIAPDPTNRFGNDTFLFVKDGKLWRSSPSQILNGCDPIVVGIESPCLKPVTSILQGQGCVADVPPDMCAPRETESCETYIPPEAVSYRYTYVTACGEESAPSPASDIVDRPYGDAVAIATTETAPENATKIRWYKTAIGAKGEVVWLFLGETSIEQSGFIDNKCAFELGEELVTEEHDPPPSCIKGVAAFGDVGTVVWTTREIFISEPMLPNAYKYKNKLKIFYDIVGVQHYIDNVEGEHTYKLAVLTDGKPYVVVGYLPELPTIKEIQDWQPCVSAASICVGEGLVYYTSPHGIVQFTGSNAKVITSDYMTEIEWKACVPDSASMCYWGGRLWCFTSRKGYQIRVSNSDVDRVEQLTEIDFAVTACTASPDTYMYVSNGTLQPQLWQWCADVNKRMIYEWVSRVEVQAVLWYPVSIKIEAERGTRHRVSAEAKAAYDLWKVQNRNNDDGFICAHPEYTEFLPALIGTPQAVELTIYADDEEFYRRPVTHSRPIRLPRVRRALKWAVKVRSSAEISEIHLQTSNEDLSQEGGAM